MSWKSTRMPCFVAAGALALIGLRSRSAILRNGLWYLARHRRIGIVAAQDLVWYEPVVCYVVGSLLLGAMLMQLDLARGPTECTALRLHAARILKKTAVQVNNTIDHHHAWEILLPLSASATADMLPLSASATADSASSVIMPRRRRQSSPPWPYAYAIL